jgi:hypothetical protein
MQSQAYIALILDAELEELFKLKLTKQSSLQPFQQYIEILIAFFKGDNDLLANLASDSGTPLSFFNQLGQVRLNIRTRKIDQPLLSQLLQAAKNRENFEGMFYGEALILAAKSYSVISDYPKAQKYYQQAYQELSIVGAHKKSLRALLNEVAVESKITPKKKLIFEYSYIAKQALELGQNTVASICYLNISREYHLLKAYDLAFSFCLQAENNCTKDDLTLHYYQIIVHKTHLFIDLEKIKEAYIEYQKAQYAPFIEIQSALKVVEQILANQTDTRASKIKEKRYLSPTWRERLEKLGGNNQDKASPLTESEESMLKIISKKPSSKFEIIKKLYGEAIDFDSLENRFKVTLSRIRKKRPGLITLAKKLYSINDEGYLFSNQVSRIQM